MREEDLKEEEKQIQLVVFWIGNEEFGAAITSVLEIAPMLPITHVPDAPGFVEGVVNLRGQVVAVVDLARQFGMKPRKAYPSTARIVVVQPDEEIVGLIVDDIPEVLRLHESDIEPTPEVVKTKVQQVYVKGVGKLGKRLIIVLDLKSVLSPHEVKEVRKLSEKKR